MTPSAIVPADKALKYFSSICRESTRTADIFGRRGGKEFTLILPDTELEPALNVAKRIRKTLKETPPLEESKIPKMSVCMGLAIPENNETLESTLIKIEKLLYKAKTGGRNHIEYQINFRGQ
ncbi:MAG: GGDEF domain-containing protein [Spirochaetales bacterium]|nr:GGDEF domain-containing protein [Spirochaetales bacterium]